MPLENSTTNILDSLSDNSFSVKRNTRLVFIGNFTHWCGYSTLVGLQGIYVLWLGASLFALTLMATLPHIMLASISLVWSRYSDHSGDRKRPIVVSRAAMMILGVGFLFVRDVWILILLNTLFHIFYAAYVPVSNAYISAAGRERSATYMVTSGALGWFTGSWLSLSIFTIDPSFTYSWIFMFSVFIISFIAYSSISKLPRNKSPQTMELTKSSDQKTHLDEPKRQNHKPHTKTLRKSLAVLIFFASLAQTGAITTFSTFFGPYYITILSGHPALYGITQGLPTLVGTFCIQFLAKKFDSKTSLNLFFILYTFVSLTAVFSLILILPNPLIITILWMLPLTPVFYVSMFTLITLSTTHLNRARGMAIFNSGTSVGETIGPILGSAIVVFISLYVVSNPTLNIIMPFVILGSLGFALMGLMCAFLIYYFELKHLPDSHLRVNNRKINTIINSEDE